MNSIYERALGVGFADLHTRIRERYGFDSTDGVACVGRGRMRTVESPAWVDPALALTARRHLLFPETGQDVPFTIRNYAYRDGFDREAMVWARTFQFTGRERHFDATMVYHDSSEGGDGRDGIVDYLGTHGDVSADITLRACPDGALHIRARDQRLHVGGRTITLPGAASAFADVFEWYDDRTDRYEVDVTVHNPLVGRLLRYRGWFELEWIETGTVPEDLKPVREVRAP